MQLIKKYKWRSLTLLALLCGLLFRLEVEYHGWEGLIWASYFHYAIPVGFLLWLLWANCFIELAWWKQLLLNALALAMGVLFYYGIAFSLHYNFQSGPAAFVTFLTTPQWQIDLYRMLILLLVPALPFSTTALLRLFGQKVPIWYPILALLGLVLALPVSILILDWTDHVGGADVIHTLKSGIIVPFWVFSMGLVLIGVKNH